MKEKLEHLQERRSVTLKGGGEEKQAKQREKGKKTARERLEQLLDPSSFVEIGVFAQSDMREASSLDVKNPGEGVVTGYGTIEGRRVYVYAQDFTVSGGSLGERHAEKICRVMDLAAQNGTPLLGINDSGGARIQEGVDSLAGYGQVFFKNVLLSGVVPQIAVIAGPCAGGAAYSPALTDFLIMTRDHANMFICGPSVIKAATGEKAELEQFASAAAHASVSGNIHLVADDDRHAMEMTAKLLSYLPRNNLADPPHEMTDLDLSEDPEMDAIVPESGKDALDVEAVIERLVDDGEFFEIMPDFARNILIGFARIQGVVVGIVANNPMVRAGTLDIDSSDKGARFIRTCNIYNIPIVSLVDVPGFMPGLAQERGGIIRHGAKMLFAYAASTVPKITLIMRKAYGGAYLAMCSADMGADMVFAWPTAEIAVMGAEGAVPLLFRNELKNAADPKARARELTEAYQAEFSSPYQAASNAMITDVILPSESRASIALALRNTLSKRDSRPPKKHGNIPL